MGGYWDPAWPPGLLTTWLKPCEQTRAQEQSPQKASVL